MKRKILLSLTLLFVSVVMMAQTKTVAILGDSYSTFEGYLTPAENYVWYFEKYNAKQTDVERVEQTWLMCGLCAGNPLPKEIIIVFYHNLLIA